MGYELSDRSVAGLLKGMAYKLPAIRPIRLGASHPDCNAQFEYINHQTLAFQKTGHPVIAVDARKAVTANNGWVSAGTDEDSAEFAVETIRRWWRKMGCRSYPRANELLIVADAGDKPSPVWKQEIQRFADQTRLKVSICCLPLGTSKWLRIEHEMFSLITHGYRGRSRACHHVTVSLIGHTTTRSAPKIKGRIDNGPNNRGTEIIKPPDASPDVKPASPESDWNYAISPRMP